MDELARRRVGRWVVGVAALAATLALGVVALDRLLPDVDSSPNVVRLFEHPAFQVASALDAADRTGLLARGRVVSRVRFSERSGALRLIEGQAAAPIFGRRVAPGHFAARVNARGAAGEVLEIGPYAVALLPIPVRTGRAHLVTLDAPDTDPRHPPVVVELTELPAPGQLEVVREVRGILAGGGLARHVLEPTGEPGRFEGLIRERSECRALLLGVASEETAAALASLEVRETSPLVARLLGAPSTRPSLATARRVGVGGDHREALLLETPARVSARIGLPPRSPVVRFAVATFDPTSPVILELSLHGGREARGDDDGPGGWRRVIEVPPSASTRWFDVRETLPTDHRDAELVVALTGGSAGVAITGPVVVGRPGDEPRPDVVLVSLDTVRADRTSAYGYARDTTPNLAALASASVRFSAAIAPASFTLPSHGSILSGQHPERHGARVIGERISAGAAWLPSDLRRAGYRTVAFTGGGLVHPDFGFARGFERYDTRDPCQDLLPAPRGRAGEDARPGVFDELRAELRAERRRPLFLFVHTYAAHMYSAPDADLVAVGADPAAARALLDPVGRDDLLTRLQELGADEGRREVLRGLYDASLRVADRVLGRVLEELRDAGRDDAIVIVLSDHGEELFERGAIGHGLSVHEELIRVPLVARGRGFEPGVRDGVVSLVDVAPTLRELCGLPRGAGVADGRSLAPVLRGGELTARAAYAWSPGPQMGHLRALRGRADKVIEREAHGTPVERWLFDLAADPYERRDLAPERPARAQELTRHLRRVASALQASAAGATDAPLSPERIAELRALGYLGD